MNRNLFLAGGLVLVAGGLTYWYLSRNGEIRCSQHNTESECVANNCFWYDGACHSDPPQHIPCADLGATCNVEGYTMCDMWKNLCRCQNGEWVCIQNQAPICFSGEEYYKCFNVGGYTSCLPVPGTLEDECWGLGYNCPCDVANCHELAFCDGRVGRCFQKAQSVVIAADNSNWESCFPTAKPYCTSCCDNWDHSGYTCDFDIGETYAATTIIGQIEYEWTTPVSGVSTAIYGYLENIGWTYLGSHGGIGGGPHSFSIMFGAQGLSKLRFASCSTYWVNSKPKSFYGHLSY